MRRRANLGFNPVRAARLPPGERFYEYARALEYEAWKYDWSTEKRTKKYGNTDPAKWQAYQNIAARRFVEKIVRMVEAMR